MKPIAIINNNYNDLLYIEYLVGTTCNFKCHYCFEGCNDGKYRFTNDLDTLKKNLGHMFTVYKEHFNKKKIRLNVTGGEPSLWPQLGEFAEHFNKEYGCNVTLITNGSRTMRFWKEYAKYFGDICISVHNEFCDVDHTIEMMDWVYNNTDCLINAVVLMDPKNWDRCVSIVDKMAAHPTPWLLKVRPVLFQGDMTHYTSEQNAYIKDKIKKLPPQEWIQRMKDLGNMQTSDDGMNLVMENKEVVKADTFTIFQNNWHHFNGWKCNIGIDRFYIGMNGDITGACGARNLFNIEPPLSIYDPELTTKFTKEVIVETTCKQLYCDCPTETKLPKRKYE